MAARATLNKLKPQIDVISNTLQDVKLSLRGTDARVRDVTAAEERLEDRVDFIEEQVELIKEHLNKAIKRINDIHKYVDTYIDKDLYCHEEVDFSDLSDDEQIIKN